MRLEQLYSEIRKSIAKIEDPEARDLCRAMLADLIAARDEVERLRAAQKTLFSAGWSAGYDKGKLVGS